ncbi:MAG: adenylosuccinate lyase [Candidatus Dadabacteria bacterium]|nr:adenylosuccinate lyase [Candidatus Dadabacteria bacterium]MYA48413.1 adenylosuccinate lyase [Candidatus Dadabacteria bacterium]MYF47392.1 adenylosuccinate lyase [Candidatus Dadabacteria bacterium]MYG82272.1 adenylosuccinate lyase [Candidatus Dadabacteria bacterium]MYK48936.1 adenylosuccinate lyase [Candidatus Dadabacteria bacterium]
MISRYSREEMSQIWSDENRYRIWLEVELAVCEAWAHYGEIPADALSNIKEKADFDVKRIEELETTLKHDVLAFLTCVSEYVGDDSRFVHLGMTSSDVLDTAFSMQLREAGGLIVGGLEKLLGVLRKKAFDYKDTAMIGRSHGIHAEPRTLGLVFALWYDEMRRNLERMNVAREAVSVGMMSGAVGTYANITPEVEHYACELLGLRPAGISTQVIQRDIYAQYFLCLSLIAASVEKIATEIRHYQRTEVGEMEEPFTEGQKGSSAMPHKRNPVLSENLCGLSRIVRSHSIAALENIALWHERDISHSSVERIIGPDGTILVDFMLERLCGLIEGLRVYPERLEGNIWITRGLVFSQKVLLELVKKGISREDAYSLVQRNAMLCWEGKKDFREMLKSDGEVTDVLSEKEIDSCFELKEDLKNVDRIFATVFGES